MLDALKKQPCGMVWAGYDKNSWNRSIPDGSTVIHEDTKKIVGMISGCLC